ncbi:MAG: hypothetical protein M2R45_00802 [Verrucomicrobia subdivision 3 bacterium]|nr:hypothetical protein [Limisphaerales bacterium]MCS1413093.1 hypothetical protein [Limisphaerales bacterium]
MRQNEVEMGVGVTDLNQGSWWNSFVTHLVSKSNTLYLNATDYFRDEIRPDGPEVMS